VSQTPISGPVGALLNSTRGPKVWTQQQQQQQQQQEDVDDDDIDEMDSDSIDLPDMETATPMYTKKVVTKKKNKNTTATKKQTKVKCFT